MAGRGVPLAKVLGEIARGTIPAILVTRFDPNAGEDLFGRRGQSGYGLRNLWRQRALGLATEIGCGILDRRPKG